MLPFALMVTIAAAPELSLTVTTGTPCVTEARLQDLLRARGLSVRAMPLAGGLIAHVRPATGAVVLTATRDGRQFARRISADGASCASVERVVIALLESWSRPTTTDGLAGPRREPVRVAEQPEAATERNAVSSTEHAPPIDPPARTAPEPTPNVRERPVSTEVSATPQPAAEHPSPARSAAEPTSNVREARASTEGSSVPQPVAEPTPNVRERTVSTELSATSRPAAEDPPPARAAEAPTSTVRDAPSEEPNAEALTAAALSLPAAASIPPAETPFHVDVMLWGGGSLDGSPRGAGLGMLGVRAGLSRWGLLLDGALETERTGARDGVRAAASSQSVSLSFSVGFEPSQAWWLDVALGVRGWRLQAAATGVDVATDRVWLSWGGVASAGAAYRLIGPLFLSARLFGALRSREYALQVDPLGTVFTLSPLIFGAVLGAQVHFR